MVPSGRLTLVLIVAFTNAASAVAQTRPAPFYSLPEDGVWVEYSRQASDGDGRKHAGVLRLASVGRKEVRGVSYRWIEITRRETEAEESRQRVRKLLVAEQAFGRTRSLPDNVQEGFERVGSDGTVRLSAQRLDDFVRLGLRPTTSGFATVQAREKIELELGKFVSRHVSIQGESRSRAVIYHGWLTDEVPFGCARFEIREEKDGAAPRILFSATASRTGKGARSELDLSNAR
jgi:hypothetical protein